MNESKTPRPVLASSPERRLSRRRALSRRAGIGAGDGYGLVLHLARGDGPVLVDVLGRAGARGRWRGRRVGLEGGRAELGGGRGGLGRRGLELEGLLGRLGAAGEVGDGLGHAAARGEGGGFFDVAERS